MEVKSKLLDVFLICFTPMKMPAIWSKEGCLVRRKKVLLVVFLVVVLFFGREGVPGAWCVVKKIEGLGEDLWCLEKEGA